MTAEPVLFVKQGPHFVHSGLVWASAFLIQVFDVQKENLQQCFHVKTSSSDKNQFACLEGRVLLPVGMLVIQLQDNTWRRRAKEWYDAKCCSCN